MTRELYVNGSLIDLGDDVVIALNLQVHDLADLQSRQAVRSNKFRVPFTQVNHAAFGFANNPQSGSARPYRKLSAKYVVNGAEIVSDGYCIVESATNDFYNLTIYGGNIDFFTLIDGLKLSDLDLSAYDHEYTLANIMATWTNTSGFKYPLIDWGELDDNTISPSMEYPATSFRPAFFFSTLVNKIFSEQGYSVTGSVLSRPDYLKLLMPFATEQAEELFANSFGFQITYGDWTPISFTVDTPAAWVNTKDTIGVGNGDVDEFLYLRLLISNTNPFSPAQYVKIYVSDPFTATYTLVATFSGNGLHSLSLPLPAQTTVYQRSILIEVKECWGEILEGRLSGVGTTDATKYYSVNIPRSLVLQAGGIEKYAWAGMSAQSDVIYFETTDMQRYAPAMTQKDFLLAVMNMFCLFPITDSMKREVRLVSFADVVANKSQNKDWTDKIHDDKRKTHSTTFRKGSFGQTNYFAYTVDSADEDLLVPTFARGEIPIDDETLPPTRTLVTLPFAASVMVRRLAGIDVPLIRMIEDEVFKNSVTPRVLIDDTQNVATPIEFVEGASASTTTDTNIPLVYFQLLSKTFNLGYDSSLLRDNYQELAAMLQRMKILSRLVDLKLPDVVNFDFAVPVFLGQYSAFFYVNRMNNFKPERLTQTEFIMI